MNGLNYSDSKSINITQQNKYFVTSWKDRSQTELCQRKTVQIKLNRLRRPYADPPLNHCSWTRIFLSILQHLQLWIIFQEMKCVFDLILIMFVNRIKSDVSLSLEVLKKARASNTKAIKCFCIWRMQFCLQFYQRKRTYDQHLITKANLVSR